MLIGPRMPRAVVTPPRLAPEQAIDADLKSERVYSSHPRFVKVPCFPSFEHKLDVSTSPAAAPPLRPVVPARVLWGRWAFCAAGVL